MISRTSRPSNVRGNGISCRWCSGSFERAGLYFSSGAGGKSSLLSVTNLPSRTADSTAVVAPVAQPEVIAQGSDASGGGTTAIDPEWLVDTAARAGIPVRALAGYATGALVASTLSPIAALGPAAPWSCTVIVRRDGQHEATAFQTVFC